MLVPYLALLAIGVLTALAWIWRRPRAVAKSRAPFWRWLWAAMGVLSLALAALFAFAFYAQFWRWRDCFNELGRCYDPVQSVVYLEQSGMIWGGMTVIALVAASLFLSLGRRH